MSYIWTFAPESKELLQRCLNAAAPPNDSNRWLQKFGPNNLDLIGNTLDTITVDDSPEIGDSPVTQESEDEDITKAIEEFLDPDIDLVLKFNNLIEKCRKTPKLLMKLAETLPISIAEKLFEHILATEDINNQFLEDFFKYFVHSYTKREQSRFCTDILLQTYNKYPKYAKTALKVILKDSEIQNNVVNDFILKLNANDQGKFLEILSEIEFTPQEFSHNLFNILTAYKSCNKTESLQKYIFSSLKMFADFCSSDKNYGKLFLAYLQYENSEQRNVNYIVIEDIIERHKTAFKKPCWSLLKEIKDRQ